MNSLQGKIVGVKSQDQLSVVEIGVGEYILKAVVLETPSTADYLADQQSIRVLFKETEVVIGLPDCANQVSLQNQLPGTISAIKQGKLLSELTLETKVGVVVSIISAASVDRLNLEVGTEVLALIKTNEIMLAS